MPIIVSTLVSPITAGSIISRAMRLIGQVGAGESPTVAEYADALVTMNAMLSSWDNDGLMCYAKREEQFSLAATQASYTIGPTGVALVTARPVSIEYAYVRENGYDHPVLMLDAEGYARVAAKTSASDWPEYAYYAPTQPNGTVYVYPVPDNSTHAFRIVTRTPLSSFAATTDSAELPPGWAEALATNLAINLAPEYETQASATVVAMARDSLKGIRRSNSEPILARHEGSAVLRRNILTDE